MFRQALVAMALFTAWASAQTPQYARLMTAKVKPSHQGEFRDLQKKATEAYKKAGTARRSVYTPAALGDQRTWYGITPLAKFGDLDNPPVPKVMGDAAYAAFMNRAGQCVDEVRYEVIEYRPELTIDSGTRPAGVWMVTIIQLKVAKEEAFEQIMKAEVMPALKKAGVKDIYVHRVVAGGPVGLYRIASPIGNLAGLEQGSPVARAMGKEAWARYREKVADWIVSASNETVSLDTELSYFNQP